MSVRIVAYRGARPVDCANPIPTCDLDEHVTVTDLGFPASFEGLREGCYTFADRTEIADMSYGGYGRWREMLCAHIHGVMPHDVWADRSEYLAFADVIDFADNEGGIGPAAVARLAFDFRKWADTIDGDLGAGFAETYTAWLVALDWALKVPGPLVVFR